MDEGHGSGTSSQVLGGDLEYFLFYRVAVYRGGAVHANFMHEDRTPLGRLLWRFCRGWNALAPRYYDAYLRVTFRSRLRSSNRDATAHRKNRVLVRRPICQNHEGDS